jgi:hypothetical protein
MYLGPLQADLRNVMPGNMKARYLAIEAIRYSSVFAGLFMGKRFEAGNDRDIPRN